MSNRTHLIISFAVAAIACLWLVIPGVKELAADNMWYVASGRQIIGMNLDRDNLVFSPLYSILSFAWHSISLKLDSTISIAIEGLACFLFSAFTWYLLLAIPRFSLAPAATRVKGNAITRTAILALFIFNPVLLKYSLPIFSDSYSVIGGTLFAFFHGMNANLFHHENRRHITHEVDPVSKTLLNLHQKPALYFSIVSILCLFRYGNFFILLASILFYLGSSDIKDKVGLSRANLKAFRLLLITSSATISVITIDFALSFYKSSISTLFGSLSSALIPSSKITEKLLIVLFLTVGGREGFRWTINDPTALLNFNSLQNQYLKFGYYMSYLEYIFSLAYLSLMIIAFFVSIFGMWRRCRQIMWPYILGITVLLITEIAINIAHQRYFLPFMPSLYLGLFFFVCCLKIYPDPQR